MQNGVSRSPATGTKYPPEITDVYEVKDTIGTGGFAKVKIARHRLTDARVAIKIMLKEKLRKTNDLKRVALEIQALKALKHQNICRLYQVIETEDRYFLVLEYAPGGELFDYIVTRSRCKEDEARFFFRQIVSAVHYMHTKGYIHRDLKPENLLLDSKRNIKLIDFGLIAKTSAIATDMLATCCGSAAYAAPELIRGEQYLGAPADVWSLGILLYALLCGFLPFDDDNTQRLYKLIQRGTYEIPPWLSKESEDFIATMLRHRPEHRITIDQLLSHPWMLKGLNTDRIDPSSTIEEGDELHAETVQELARYYGTSIAIMENWIKERDYGILTANYELVKEKFLDGKSIRLPRGQGKLPPEKAVLLLKMRETRRSSDGRSSPLAFSEAASRAGSVISITTEECDALPTPVHRSQAETPPSSNLLSPTATVVNQRLLAINSPSGGRARSRTVGTPDAGVVTSMLGNSPKRADAYGGSMHNIATKDEGELKRRSSNPMLSPAKQGAQDGSQPAAQNVGQARRGSALKQGLGNLARSLFNVFGSRNLTEPRLVKGLFNADSTSTKSAEEVMAEIERVLRTYKCDYSVRGFHIRAKFFDDDDKNALIVNFEVCRVERMQGVVGVRPKRIKGDTWLYSKVVKELFQALRL
eukprot:m.80713 g.80713  ORF g.80713 m.80713 type:complete len:643 (+) comp14218_c1_seq2:357-2285(+)